jgi:hypothetical protein
MAVGGCLRTRELTTRAAPSESERDPPARTRRRSAPRDSGSEIRHRSHLHARHSRARLAQGSSLTHRRLNGLTEIRLPQVMFEGAARLARERQYRRLE